MSWWRWLSETAWAGIPLMRWGGALLLLVGGYFLARLLAKGLSRLFYLTLGKAQADISRKELHRLMRPAWLFPLFLFLAYGAGLLVEFGRVSPTLLEWGQRVFQALALLSIGLLGSRLLAVAETILASRYQVAGETYKLQLVHPLFTIGRIVLFLLVGFLMLELILKVNVAPFFTTLGLGGLAVALAAQETLQHFLGAVVIFADKPFQIGDVIRLDPNTIGTVEKIGLRSTHIRTVDNLLLVIPNKKLADSPLENLTRAPERRILFRIGLLYSTPTDTLRAVINDLQESLAKLDFLSRPPMVFFANFQESALEVTIITFVNVLYKEPESQEPLPLFYFQDRIAWVILETVRKHAPVADFAFPTRTLHIERLPAHASLS
ncbi:MAG: mechanosensitive ion channel family protein [Bacteroidia bacterium]|nr:mechanosensitive ion channel family protein [Bacteroidia bacterium]GIV24189.1 MAG: hypothetical protein KatS3mg025_1848 [Bacteroidia bacterium]